MNSDPDDLGDLRTRFQRKKQTLPNYLYSRSHHFRDRLSRNTHKVERERKAIPRCLEGEPVAERNESASKRKSVIAVEEERNGIISPLVKKYWLQRYNLFSMYDEGIKMDEEGWFSVTPEEIAIKHAERAGGGTVIDCFSGVGGNSIQFARMSYHVVAIDIDPQKVALAFNNAKIYGVEDYIDFVVADFFQLASSLKADVVFLSPPWGGPAYSTVEQFTLDLFKPKDGYSIFQAAQRITPNIIMFLPRNVDLHQVEELSWLSSPPLSLEASLFGCINFVVRDVFAIYSPRNSVFAKPLHVTSITTTIICEDK